MFKKDIFDFKYSVIKISTENIFWLLGIKRKNLNFSDYLFSFKKDENGNWFLKYERNIILEDKKKIVFPYVIFHTITYNSERTYVVQSSSSIISRDLISNGFEYGKYSVQNTVKREGKKCEKILLLKKME